MIRTQIYIEEALHKELSHLAKVEKEPMAKIVRGMLREGVTQRKTIDRSGKKVLEKLINISIASGGDDPYVSENHDHYLYGAPKKRT